MSGRPVVWFSGASWDGIRGTDRHLATALSAHVPVLWVDPPVSVATVASRRSGAPRTLRPRLTEAADGIARLTPVALPGLTRPGVRATTAPLQRSQVRKTLRRLGVTPAAVVATHLDDVLGYWGAGVTSVLYGTDDYVAGAELLGQPAARLRADERRALARADVVAAVTRPLADRWAALGARPAVLPNGCLLPAAGRVAPALPELAGPVVGVVGQLSERIDLAVLEAVADTGLTLLLVGPRAERWEPARFAALVARSTVRYAGRVPAAAVPAHLASVDVGLTPYTDSDFNRSSFPLKTLEYLAAGMPVVTTALPAAEWLRADAAASGDPRPDDLLALASGPAAVAAAVRRLAAAPSPAERCRAFAARHSWDRRAADFARLIRLPLDSGLARDPLEVS